MSALERVSHWGCSEMPGDTPPATLISPALSHTVPPGDHRWSITHRLQGPDLLSTYPVVHGQFENEVGSVGNGSFPFMEHYKEALCALTAYRVCWNNTFLVSVRIAFSFGEHRLALSQRWFQVTTTRLYSSHLTSSVFPRSKLIMPQSAFSWSIPWLPCTWASMEQSWFPTMWPLISGPHQQTYLRFFLRIYSTSKLADH